MNRPCVQVSALLPKTTTVPSAIGAPLSSASRPDSVVTLLVTITCTSDIISPLFNSNGTFEISRPSCVTLFTVQPSGNVTVSHDRPNTPLIENVPSGATGPDGTPNTPISNGLR